ncbi:putative Cullin binding [Trypanosoma vivax]|uniref:Defective in cullin neddylation protein n=1 Tax=Trypanosoma vivax (strain Y486) TaxID=1055687 RepID=G0TTS4_TRYVY|nr:hypothetical protein TRVL_00075 [Trypanosoma vivax]KAH8613756.1 putative Cullin binding [Trypanosoma vivax]CCC47355.1 conserved hypothetical protein [Trypanosoma vivax Y486]
MSGRKSLPTPAPSRLKGTQTTDGHATMAGTLLSRTFQRTRSSSLAAKLSGPGVSSSRNELERYFDRLASPERKGGTEIIRERGVQRLCKDLSIAKDSFDMYVLVWKLGATQSGCIPRADWLSSVYHYKIESLVHLRRHLSEWVKEARGNDFIQFVGDLYDYVRGEDARMMQPAIAARAWALLFTEEPRIESWIKWYSTVYNRDVTRDIWRHVPLFFSTFSDLSLYSNDGMWPCAFDEYVEWCRTSTE